MWLHRDLHKTQGFSNDRDQSIGQDGEEYEMDSVATALQVHLAHWSMANRGVKKHVS